MISKLVLRSIDNDEGDLPLSYLVKYSDIYFYKV